MLYLTADVIIISEHFFDIFFQEVLEGKGGAVFPAAHVVPTNGELFWLVDDPAAASLTIQVERLNSGDKL